MTEDVDYAYLGDGVGVTKTHRGHRIFVYTKDFGLSPHIIMSGVWEWAIEHAVLKLFSPGDTVIEVGCNMGYHTLAICDQLGPDGRFFGFEANPEVFRLLHWSVDHNGFFPRAKLFNHAVTEVPGEVQFTFDPVAVGGGHVTSDGASAGELITIPGLPLDDVLPDLESVALLRMDIEGFEPFAIRGARELLSRSPDIHIVVEWSVSMMAPRLNLHDFVEEMDAQGFRAWMIDGQSCFNAVSKEELLHLPHCEIVFSRSDLAMLNPEPAKEPESQSTNDETVTAAFPLPPKRNDMTCKLCGSHASLAFGLPYSKKSSHPIPDEPDDSWYYQCDNCQFLFSDVIDYQDSHVDIYDETYWENQDPDWYGRVSETFRLVALANELLNIRLDQAEILDFGCGIGGFVEMGRRSLNLNVWGTDIIPPKVGQEYFLPDLGDRKFDIITSCEVIEHLPNPRAVFDKIKSHLKPKGVFAFQTAQWDPEALGRDWWYLGPNNGHISLYSSDGLTHVFNEMGGVERRLWNDYAGVQAWLFQS